MPLHSARGGSSTWSLSEHDPGERFLARSIPPLALRTRVCLRRGHRHRTLPARNLSKRSAALSSRVDIVHFLLFLTSSTCRELGKDCVYQVFKGAVDNTTADTVLLAQHYWMGLTGQLTLELRTILPKAGIERRWLALIFLTLPPFRQLVIENCNGNNLFYKESQWRIWLSRKKAPHLH